MKRVFSFTLISFFVFNFSCSSQIDIPHKTEKITFQKDRFHIVGELKIPGYSDYLHPYDENHLIGIGMDTTEVEIKDENGKIVKKKDDLLDALRYNYIMFDRYAATTDVANNDEFDVVRTYNNDLKIWKR